jgi:hypothetical protein
MYEDERTNLQCNYKIKCVVAIGEEKPLQKNIHNLLFLLSYSTHSFL